jgi:DNA-binding MarR family transcriptional regulator
MTKLILNAIRRADERRAGVRLTTGPVDRSMLDRLLPEERAVLMAVLEGQRTEQQLVEATGLPRATLREVLDRLVSARLLERAG